MRTVLAFAGLLLLIACKKPAENSGAAITKDVSYGTSASQKMDIYQPVNRSATSTPVMILVHGGGWTEGDKADFAPFITTLQQRLPNYAFVNINYRLAANGQNIFPTQENDVKAAMEFLYNQRSKYQLSDKWVFLGASAGAHLVMLQAYKYTSPVQPMAVISFFGPADLTALYNTNPLIALAMIPVMGSTPAANAVLYQQSSPYTFISAQSPPTILLQGGADPLVPAVQATMVRDKLQSLGVANQYVFYPNAGHGWTGAELADSFDKITAFVKAHEK